MVDSLLSLRGFGRRFPGGAGVGPIDLELAPGIHGLLGPNGSGKTTLLKPLLGFLSPSGGQARVLGMDVRTQNLAIRRHVGYMAENDVVVPGLNAVQSVRLAAELCGIPRAHAHEAAAEALHAVGMGEEALHDPARMSTGQRQRMKLAAALVHAPRLLILDEPTNGLDPRGRRTMLRLIQEVADEKDVSVLLSTHILPDVEAVCRDALVLRDGRLAAVESVHHRTVQRGAAGTWFRVEVLGDPLPFAQACRKAGWTVQSDDGLRVLAPGPEALVAAARSADQLVLQAVPEERGVEDAILAHMEAGPA